MDWIHRGLGVGVGWGCGEDKKGGSRTWVVRAKRLSSDLALSPPPQPLGKGGGGAACWGWGRGEERLPETFLKMKQNKLKTFL